MMTSARCHWLAFQSRYRILSSATANVAVTLSTFGHLRRHDQHWIVFDPNSAGIQLRAAGSYPPYAVRNLVHQPSGGSS